MEQIYHSAGFVIIRMIGSQPHILALRIRGSYDFPKGHVEDGEDNFDAAVRETAEEAGLTNISFPWGVRPVSQVMNTGRRRKQVTLFLGTTEQEPLITANPDTGEFEHDGFNWLTLDEAEMSLHPYLRKAIPDVRTRLEADDTLKDLISSS